MNASFRPPEPPVRTPVPLARPRWTYIFLAINIIVFLAMTVVGLQSGVGGAVVSGTGRMTPILIDFGANLAPLVASGQYWRLITANFLHIGVLHLLVNSYTLYILGRQVEALFGQPRFVAIYLLSGIAGAVLSYMLTQGLSAGASTSLFGLFGALVVYFYKHRRLFGQLGQQQLVSLGVTLAINIFLGLSPGSNIDNWGHAGGFLGGLALAWFLCPNYVPNDPLARAFDSVVAQSRRPELVNAYLIDTNSLPQQIFPVTIVAVALVALTALATVVQR